MHSSTSEDERGERNANGIIAKRHREAQGDCEAEISSGGGGLVGSSTRSEHTVERDALKLIP